jgi:hypothetical protein
MESLHMLFKKSQELGLLKKLSPVFDAFRSSLYADDATLFINPLKQDLATTDFILQIFAEASGLVTNFQKTHYFPIQCEEVDLHFLYERNVANFPCTYLGLPLHYKKPSRATL